MNNVEYKKEAKKVGRTGWLIAVLFAFVVALFPQRVNTVQAAEREVIGYGDLNATWVNLGLNWWMTGGTSGRVVKGEKFVVYEKRVVNNTNRYYVYAENAKIYGYISERFIDFTPVNELEREVIGYGKLNATWVNLGLNWEMTGGTSGRVVPGETFEIYEKKQVNGTNRYYVYAQKAGIYGYISERFLTITSLNERDADKSDKGIKLNVNLHIQETTTTCGVASVKMILDYLDVKGNNGKAIPEVNLWNWANSNGEGTHVYRMAQTLTTYGVPYKFVSMTDAGTNGYWNTIEESLGKNRPVLLPIKPTKNSYWKYNTGHYVLVTGVFEDENGIKQVVINDCHFRYGEQGKIVPLSELVRVSKNHSAYVIVGK